MTISVAISYRLPWRNEFAFLTKHRNISISFVFWIAPSIMMAMHVLYCSRKRMSDPDHSVSRLPARSMMSNTTLIHNPFLRSKCTWWVGGANLFRDQDEWEAKFNQLKTIHDETSDVKIKRENGALGCWLRRQKCLLKSHLISLDQKERLNKIGVYPSMKETKKKMVKSKKYEELWFSQLEELKKYKLKKGDCNVPKHWKENLALGRWVYQQRVKHSKNCLDPDRFQKMNHLDFEWSTQKKETRCLEDLLFFAKNFGPYDKLRVINDIEIIGSISI
jgi:hypothetical protein